MRPPCAPQIPDEIFALPLKKLAIHHAGLTRIPSQLSERLEILDLDDNALTELPDQICLLPKLARLSVARNRLARLPDAIGALPKLRTLDARDNQLTALPLSLTERRPLRELRLEGNPLPPRLSPLVLQQLKRLKAQIVPSGKTIPGVPEPLRIFVQDVVWPEGKVVELERYGAKYALTFTWQEANGFLTLFTDNFYDEYVVSLQAPAERPVVFRRSHASEERIEPKFLDELLKKVRLRAPARASKNRDQEGLTPLMRACFEQKLDEVRALLPTEVNAKLTKSFLGDVEYPQGSTALHLAIGTAKEIEIVRLLLDAGADPNACGRLCYTPLHRAATRDVRFQSSVRSDLPQEMIRLLVERGADLNTRTYNYMSLGETPLLAAGSLAGAVKQLLALGADPNIATDDGVTKLHLAAYMGDLEMVEALLAAGARPGDVVTKSSSILFQGETAKMIAERRGETAVAARLTPNP